MLGKLQLWLDPDLPHPCTTELSLAGEKLRTVLTGVTWNSGALISSGLLGHQAAILWFPGLFSLLFSYRTISHIFSLSKSPIFLLSWWPCFYATEKAETIQRGCHVFPPHASTPCFCAHTLSPLVFLWMYHPCSHLRLTPPVTDQFPCLSQLHKSSFSKFHLLLLTTDFPLCWNNSFTPCCSSHLRKKLYSSRLIVSSYSSLLNPLQCWSSPSCLWNTLSHC